MKIESIKEFTKRIKKSKSTVYRFYERNPELWLETKLKSNKRLLPVEHAKYFDSILMYDQNKVLMLENKSMKNLIDGLMDKDSLPSTLWYKDWSLFITVAYKNEKNKKGCFRVMNAYYDSLIQKYGKNNEVRMFFTTEPFTNRAGYHNHFVLYVSDYKLLDEIQKGLKDFFLYDRVDAEPYNKYEGGLFYAVKNGLVNEDWDVLENKPSIGIKDNTSTY
jgi:hypothetical protein